MISRVTVLGAGRKVCNSSAKLLIQHVQAAGSQSQLAFSCGPPVRHWGSNSRKMAEVHYVIV